MREGTDNSAVVFLSGPGEPYGTFDVADDFRAMLFRGLENDARLVFIAWDGIAFEEHALDRMIDPRRSLDCHMGGRVLRNSTPQAFIVSRRNLDEYVHDIASLNLKTSETSRLSNVPDHATPAEVNFSLTS
jgi:hypothetical protein